VYLGVRLFKFKAWDKGLASKDQGVGFGV